MAALTQLTLQLFSGPAWTAFYKAIGGSSSARKKKNTLSLAPGAAAQYGIDTLLLLQFNIAASGTTSLDLTSYTDIAGQLTQAMVRAKAMFLWLFDTSDDPTVTANPTSVTLGNAASNAARLCFGTTPGTNAITVQAGSQINWWDATAAGVAVDGTHKSVLLTNNDGTNAALGRLLIAGSQS